MPLSRPRPDPPSLRQVVSDFGAVYAANGLVAFIFAASGPVAIILTVGTRGGLSASDLSSWLFGAFFVNGLISIAFCWIYRQPLVLFWTIPGTVLVGPALEHLSFPEVIGAFLASGALVLALGLSGWVRRAMEAVPMPIVMGMVAGVFLRFGLDLVRALHHEFWIAAPMTAVFLALTALPVLARRLPPLIAAILVGIAMIAALGGFHPVAGGAAGLARPTLHAPAFSWTAMVELVVPLAVTVLVVQNAQGIAVLRAAGHRPPIDAITVACGAGSLLTACLGTVSTCLTGPVNAIISGSGDTRRRYTAGMTVGLLGCLFGLLSPSVTRLMLATPGAFIPTVAGLAMLRVLQSAFAVAFRDRCALGALVAFLVTVADIELAGIGAPFWGLLFGVAVTLLLERDDLAAG
ncbi:MAG TPA: benzoate/H(+) symporter BenE family transporter [Candidatus Nitrosotalea sp.]|nr:benzoate/H(+) symporter BenE family transporter [Candidatus Nitrosotalea sp.]